MGQVSSALEEWMKDGAELRRIDPDSFSELSALVKRLLMARRDPASLAPKDSDVAPLLEPASADQEPNGDR